MIIGGPRPTYAQGFARSAAESANPNLWKGLVGLWAPYLGPTGLTLFDWGGRKNNGTLTNGPTWAASRFGWVLNYTAGADRYVDASAASYAALGTFSNVALVYINASPSAQQVILKAGTHGFQYQDTADSLRYYNGAASIDAAGAWTLGAWNHMAVTADGTTLRHYVNGQEVKSTAFTTAQPAIDFIGWYSAAQHRWIGQIAEVIISSRAYTSAEIQHLHRDPYALTRPRSRPYAVTAAAVGNPWYQYAQEAAVAG